MNSSITNLTAGQQVPMRNKILSITKNVVPYVKELRTLPLVKSTNACLLMQQLDYWFVRYPDGFYKFLEPCEHTAYIEEKSWTEELSLSADEFRTAFDQIGVRYKSATEYHAAVDKFQGKYYCSYTDKIARLTYYFRNHEMVDAALDTLSSTETHDVNLYKSEKTISRDGHSQPREVGNVKSDYKEINKDTN